jgi:hypothetical protein
MDISQVKLFAPERLVMGQQVIGLKQWVSQYHLGLTNRGPCQAESVSRPRPHWRPRDSHNERTQCRQQPDLQGI